MLEALSLSKKYGGFTALQDFSLQIQPGEVVGLLGPNGAGKTTTLRLLTGYFRPSSGEVKVSGYDLSHQPREAKEKIGYLPENPPLYSELTVEEMLHFIANLRKIPASQKKEKIDWALEKTKTTGVRRRLISQLSKGYRQRVGLAQAILHQPTFLILDEPTIGLDPKQIFETRELIQDLKRSSAIILSSHILQEVTAVCDRVVILNQGKIVGREMVSEHISDLENLFLKLTEDKDAGDVGTH